MNRRVMFDTSTLISAAILTSSVPQKALLKAFSEYRLCASPATQQELEQVLARTKFDRHLNRQKRDQFVSLVHGSSQLFPVTRADLDSLNPPCRDSKDNMFLALAVVAQAGMIVSSDDDLLVLHPWNGVEIICPAEFLQRP